jgi:disulfide bond formation protein DsbB
LGSTTRSDNNDWIWGILFFAWTMALVASAGSLFFSEVMKYPPCILCWYQRICMYPLVLILPVGLFPLNQQVAKFCLPLVILGLAIAGYHNLLYYQLIPESAAPCQQGISCTTAHIEWLGFLTIPLLSLISFTLILVSFLLTKNRKGKVHDEK